MSSELTQEYLNEEEWWLEEGYANPEDVPIPDWHIEILEERMARYKSEDVTKWHTWEEVRDELMRKITDAQNKKTED